MTEFLQHIINGLSVGAIYALIALGYTMVYGVLKLINFAHGDVFMVGAMMAFYTSSKWSSEAQHPTIGGAVLIAVISMAICGLIGFVIERVAYRPLRSAPRINSLITAIGVSFFIEYGGQVVFGPTPNAFGILPPLPPVQVGGLSIGAVDIITMAVALALMFGLQRIVFHTRLGTAMRAVSHNPDVAALMGVNVDFIISFTFVLGSVLAAAAGILFASKYPSVQPLMGLMPGLKAFVAAVIGGIGNVPGAMVGGLLLGLIEQLVSGYFSSQWKDAVAFALLILILLVKPSGLLGRATAEKV
ncbi:MAG: branched-chain amino acid ABC transporter permease [Deltaproteobacteria bacterium]|nr:branched-chain amino acid ABC transporter permease [Deltaproteobacteria bacterium]